MKSNTAIPICRLCFKEIEPNSLGLVLDGKPCLCRECFSSLAPEFRVSKTAEGIRLLSLYRYEEGFRNALFRFKGCGDVELAPIFLSRVRSWLPLFFRGYLLCPAPSSPTHDEKRGFNHVSEICAALKMPIVHALRKTKEHKQSDCSAEERAKVKDVLALKDPALIRGKNVLFVDDVYTTGSTMRACVSLLLEGGARKVAALVLSRVQKKAN